MPDSEAVDGTSHAVSGSDERETDPIPFAPCCPIVAVGASAGGLDAFSELLEQLPPDPGFALVLIMHLQPTHSSDLAQILGRKTAMPVFQVEDGMPARKNHVYVIPPNVEMTLNEESFVLLPRSATSRPSLPIDIFFASLAQERGNAAIGVVLSGSASDGTKGLAAIKAQDGITLVQDPKTAAHRGMPDSAIGAHVADEVLPIPRIASELIRLSAHPYTRTRPAAEDIEQVTLSSAEETALAAIVARVKMATGLDLTHYKRPTLVRRVQRRMAMRHVDTMSAYATLLASEHREVGEFFTDVLVRVTSFFRDPEAFEALGASVIPAVLEHHDDETPVRIWIPGCATGQEAYSIAIVVFEYLEAAGRAVPVQLFASDLREDDLAVARRGEYPPEAVVDVSEGRLARFFVKIDGGYRIGKAIREACVFARHDVTRDPPFARLDLVSCRNLLIYVDHHLQRRLLSLFHYALAPHGALMLGLSEGTSAAPGLFRRMEHKGIYMRLPGEGRIGILGDPGSPAIGPGTPAAAEVSSDRQREWDAAQRQLDALLLARYAPAAVLIDGAYRVRQIRGDAGRYLRLQPGDVSLDLIGMVSDGLGAAVLSAVREVQTTGRPAHGVAVLPRDGGGHSSIGIVVIPIGADEAESSYAVLFDEGPAASLAEGESGEAPSELEYLRQELDAATERLRILREGRDSVNEDLRAAGEEIQSSNEELQSMNEELETAKEELQSTNEELITLNDELQARNDELTERNDDLGNLLVSASIPILVLGRDLKVRRFTSEAATAFNLIDGDIGRDITDIRWHLEVPDAEAMLASVIESGQTVEQEVHDESGCRYRMKVSPYLLGEGGIGGAVITLFDIEDLRTAQEVVEGARALSDGLNRVNTLLAATGDSSSASRALDVLRELSGASRVQLIGSRDGSWVRMGQSPGTASGAIELPRDEVEQLGLCDLQAEPCVVEWRQPRGASRLAIPLRAFDGATLGALSVEFGEGGYSAEPTLEAFLARCAADLALYAERERSMDMMEQHTARRTAELKVALAQLESASDVKNAFLANMSHELRTPLNSIIGFSSVMLEGMAGDVSDEQRRQLEMVLRSGKHLLAIISDLLDLEKITAGAMPVKPNGFEVGGLLRSVIDLLMPVADSKGIELALSEPAPSIMMRSDEQKLRQILLNLVSNAIKFTDSGGVRLALSCTEADCIIEVFDTGRGMTPEQLGRAFRAFEQVGEQEPRTEGTGLGLSIAVRLADLLGGTLRGASTPDEGSVFTLTVPRTIDPTG